LQNCGYSKYDALFVSSESGKTKRAGTLYDEAAKCVGVTPKRWLHIGDNLFSDVRRARRRGLAVWHYPSAAERFRKRSRYFETWRPDRPSCPAGHVIEGLIANRTALAEPLMQRSRPADSFWEDFGYCSVGPLYVGLSEWLIAQVAEQKPQAIFFLS